MTVHPERRPQAGVEGRRASPIRTSFDCAPRVARRSAQDDRYGGRALRGLVGGLAIALLLCSCATPLSALTVERQLTTTMGPITLRSHPAGKPGEAVEVAKALELAEPKLRRWGALDKPVEIHLLPTHGDLESAVRRRGYDWLRAWAQYDDVLLQTPSTWATSEHDVAELLAHELTHCLMYQRSGTPEDWAKKGIPLWFREGMATFTAEQGYRWMTLEDLARVYEKGPSNDPIAEADRMYQASSAAVYAAAHYAFTFLVHRYGIDAVERTLTNMSRGQPFEAAFRGGVGLSPDRFTAEFRRYVTWRAFRGSGKPVR